MILAAGFAAWAGLEARRVRDAQVSALEGLIRAEAQALHFWLHAAQKAPGFTRPDPGTARALSRSETTKLKQIWRAPWWSPDNLGWRIRPLVATPRAQNTPEDRAHGIVVLEPEGSAGPVRHAQLDALCVALSGAANAQAERLAGRADITLDFGGEGCDRAAPGAALALFAAPLAGVDDRFVLREIRSGFATPALETDLDMGGGAITFAAPAQGQAGRPPRGRIDLPALTLTAGLDVSGQVSVRRAEISGGFVAHGPARTGGNLVIDGPATVGGCLRIEGPLRLGRLIATKGAGCRP